MARVGEGIAARQLGATAMIDISDGLTADLGHVLDASGVGVSLADVPVAEGATMDEALGGGEDYELLWSCPPGVDVAGEFERRGLRRPCRIGVIVADQSVRPPASGWSHTF
jgi:thiamine-monophosphate kinase